MTGLTRAIKFTNNTNGRKGTVRLFTLTTITTS